MAGEQINIGSIVADLDVNSGRMAEGLAQGQTALNKIMAELKLLDAQLKSGAIGFDAYVKRTADLSTAAGEISGKMRAANEALMAGTSAVDLLNQKLAAAGGAGRAAAEGIRNLEVEIATATGKVYAMADSYAVLDAASAKAFREGVAAAPETKAATRKSTVEALRAEFEQADNLAREASQRQMALAEEAHQKQIALAQAMVAEQAAAEQQVIANSQAAHQKQIAIAQSLVAEQAAAEQQKVAAAEVAHQKQIAIAQSLVAEQAAAEQQKAAAAEAAYQREYAAAVAVSNQIQAEFEKQYQAADEAYQKERAEAIRTAEVMIAQMDKEQKAKMGQMRSILFREQELAAKGASTATANLTATTARMTQTNREAGGAVSNLSIGMMQLGYIADDLQYGFQAVVNNVAPAVYSFARAAGMAAGSAAGLSAAIQLTSVLAYQLYKNWDSVLEAMGTDKIKTQADQIKELGEATKLTADQTERLNKLQSVEAKGKELHGAKTEGEKKAEDVATKTIIEGDIENFIKGLLKTAPHVLDEDPEVLAAKLELKRLERVKSGEEFGGILERNIPAIKQGLAVLMGTPRAEIPTVEEHARQAVVDARQKVEDARKSAAERRIAAGTLLDLNPEGLAQIRKGLKEKPNEFGPHALAMQEGLKEAQRQADMTPEERQRDVVRKGIQKTWDQFKKHFDTEVEKVITKDEKLQEKALAHQVKKAFPDIKAAADRLAMQEDAGEIERANSLKHIQDTLMEGGIGREDAEKAALKAMEKTAEEDADVRRKRVEREAVQKADELNAKKDLKNRASRLAQDVDAGKITAEEAHQRMTQELSDSGLGRDDAVDAANVFMREAGKEKPQDRSRRLKREALGKAAEIVPDVSDVVESAVAKGLILGTGTGEFAAGLDRTLREGGMEDAAQRQDAVKGLLDKGKESVRQRLASLAAGHQPGQEEPSRSEVFATSQLTAKVQAGVGTQTEPKKQTTLLEKLNETLLKMANKSVVQIEVS